MTAQTDGQHYTESTGVRQNSLGIEVPVVPRFWFGPETWNLVYYAVLILSVGFGFVTYVVSGSLIDALLYFFITLVGTAFLGIAFISFVVMPLFMKHQERLREARRLAVLAERAAAIEQMEREKAERYRSVGANFAHGDTAPNLSGAFLDTEDDSTLPNTPSPASQSLTIEDQAASLRRIMAAKQ